MQQEGLVPNSSAPISGDRVIAYWVGPYQPLAFPLHRVNEEGGILESRILWEIGEEVAVELWFPGEVRHRAKIRVLGPVNGSIVGMQVRFVELSPSAQGALQRYLQRAKHS